MGYQTVQKVNCVKLAYYGRQQEYRVDCSLSFKLGKRCRLVQLYHPSFIILRLVCPL